MKSKYYRRTLGRHVGKMVSLECSSFKVTPVDEDGTMYMVLEHPKIIKMSGETIRKDWIVNHLWVQIPPEKTQYFERYLPLMRKVLISGTVYEYNYSGGALQAGVKLRDIQIMKYRKDIAKKYQLSPGQLLSKHAMDNILEREKVKKSL